MGIFSSIKNAIFGEAKAETISASTEAVAPISSAESTTSTAAETAAVATPVVPVVDVAAILIPLSKQAAKSSIGNTRSSTCSKL